MLQLIILHGNDSLGKAYEDSAILIARKSGNPKWQALPYLAVAEVLKKEHKYEAALVKTDSAIAVLKNLPVSPELAKAYGLAGSLAWRTRNSSETIAYRTKWVDALREIGNRTAYGKALNNLGVTYKNSGLNVQALDVLLQALLIAEQDNDSIQVAIVLNNLGNVSKNQNRFDQALEYHHRALSIREHLDDKDDLADSHNNLGLVYRKLYKYEQALFHFRKSLKIRNAATSKRGISFSYNNIGLVFLDLDKPDSALHYFEMSMVIKDLHGDQRDLAIGHVNMGEAYLALNDIPKAEQNYRRALELTAGLGYFQADIAAYEGLSQVLAKKGDFNEAYRFLKLHDQLEDSLEMANNEKSIADLQSTYELQKAQNELAQLEQRQRVQALELENYELSRSSMYIGLFAAIIILIVIALRYLSVNRLNKALKESNENLRETRVSKEEKETLLKEVHHRVKNNLQIITSLIRLQSGTISDPQVAAIFNESQFRIKTMALVHEELYRSDNFTSIPVREYFEKLIDGLISSYSLSGRVSFEIETDVNRLGVNTLIPLGLMANEMITNALKHAFKGIDGHIDVSLKESGENKYTLIVSDNGPGFPSDISFEAPNSLGIELINTLANQLDGSVAFSNNPGASYAVNFACQD